MKSRLGSYAIYGFWAVMMVALVRLEYSSQLAPWDEVPVPFVVQKILNNPDPAWLNIYNGAATNGYCRFEIAPIGDTNRTAGAMQYRITGDLSLSLTLANVPWRLGLTGNGRVTRQQELVDFQVTGNVGATRFEARGHRRNRRLTMTYDTGDGRGPQPLRLDWADSAGALGALGAPAMVRSLVEGARTRAYRSWFRPVPGGPAQRAFVIETKVNEELWAKLWVDEAGQVLQLDTPTGWRLRSDVLDEAGVKP